MPKYRPEIEKARAKKLSKAYIKAGLNQSELARKEGVTSQAINQRLKKNKQVPKTMAEFLDKAGVTDPYLAEKIREGCEAKKLVYVESGDALDKQGNPVKVQEFDDDYATRHKYVATALEVKKHIKADEDTKPVTIKVEYGHRIRTTKESADE